MASAKTKSTIQDVAQLAGVSKMTVSRVLNNDAKVSDKTREKVQKAAASLNYLPNISARRLASSKSYFIGLLYENPSEGYVSQFLLSALKSCRQRGYHLVVDECQGSEQEKLQITRDLVEQTRVDGVILLPPFCNNLQVLALLDELKVPYVRVSPDANLEVSPFVCMDDYQAAFDMTNHLIDQGHQQIGFIVGHQNLGASRLRYQGFLDAMRSAQLAVPPSFIEQGQFSFKSGLQAAENMLKQDLRPTAIFASNDDMAAAVVSVANSLSLPVPEKLSVVGFDDTPLATTIWPHLTTIRQPITEMAEQAIDLLTSGQLTLPPSQRLSDLRHVIEFQLMQRDSVKHL
ncbi:LacI family transcriptional regulator [Shewanella sp. WXL01]|uniref:LacI family DNA-binding transcriptional regulator n=1 Tax=Shewanella maritima TaxID=2520507 RepID=A0A411PJU4_9GAMM|nr:MULTISPECIES: LacI family DNA-binding transcriptional regulator [Shewanella]NKF51407.1 LacI family transcriptional regulator [Shewanella sp. WXL01]QBF83660.1 LacI family DNA-binding transcriptional regulator [Shewanella maritima]